MRSPAAYVAVLVLAIALSPVGARAHDDGTTHVESVVATVDGATISVSGGATFVDVPVVVAEDPSGDATVGGVGTDITTVTFSRPDPASSNLRLVAGVADQTPQINGAPTSLYHFPVAVNGAIANCGGGTGYWFPEARIASLNPADAAPSFRLMCDLSPGAVATGPDIEGAFGDGTVEFEFSMTLMGADPGDTLIHGGDCVDPGTTSSPPGGAWLCSNGGGDAVLLDDYVIPEATVSVGIAPAGTPPELVETNLGATVDPATGAYELQTSAPADPGDYVVAAEACYGPGNCGRSSTTVTIA